MRKILSLLSAFIVSFTCSQAADAIPNLRRQGTATQLWVKGAPFLVRGGELGNSSGEPDFLRASWPKLKALNLNTVVAPVYWELLEPEEGKFDFSTVDALVKDARDHQMHLVLLWFASWKNSMSTYVPAWVKRDGERFPHSRDSSGKALEILSPFSAANLAADAKAFRALMAHVRQLDEKEQTVIMIQVENEIGMIPEARDRSAEAEKSFQQPVPAELISYVQKNVDTLTTELREAWVTNGRKTAGSWNEVFGQNIWTEEFFMAWHFARFVEQVTAEGKAEYPLPMFVNAALARPGHKPGQYPSAGPLPHLFDVWRAGAPSIDFLSPDIYSTSFVDWIRKYARPGNPLFVPEALRSSEASVNALYALAAHDAIGFSPFAIEGIPEPAAQYLSDSFALVEQLTPLIVAHQGRGTMAGLLPDGPDQRQPQQVWLGGYVLQTSFEKTSLPGLADGGAAAAGGAAPVMLPAGGLVIATGPDEFLVAGIGITTVFQRREPGVGVGFVTVEEGRFVDGKWTHIRWLNGDQTHQGRHVRNEPGRFSIQKVKLYHYR